MSESDTDNPIPGLIGKLLTGVTTVALLVFLGFFGVALLRGMFVAPEQEPDAEVALTTGDVASPGPASKAPAPDQGTKAAAPAAAAKEAPSPEVVALLESGQQTFMICAACHGPAGLTLIPNMAPNLAASELVNGPNERLAMLVLNGVQFPGKYLGQMVAWKAQLTDEQIAGVLTYIRSNFGNDAPPVFPEMITAARAKHGNRDTPFSRDELDKVTTNLSR